jgi:hypothetical protein
LRVLPRRDELVTEFAFSRSSYRCVGPTGIEGVLKRMFFIVFSKRLSIAAMHLDPAV